MHKTITHTFSPVYDINSKILILGTMPSPKSREAGFYYTHPQNRFWKTIAAVLGVEVPATIEDKKIFYIPVESRFGMFWVRVKYRGQMTAV